MDEQTATFRLIQTQREIRTLDREIARLIQQRSRLLEDAQDLEAIFQRRGIPVTVIPFGNDGAL